VFREEGLETPFIRSLHPAGHRLRERGRDGRAVADLLQEAGLPQCGSDRRRRLDIPPRRLLAGNLMRRRELLRYSAAAWAGAALASVLPVTRALAKGAGGAPIEVPTPAPDQVAARLAQLRGRAQRVNPPTPEVLEAFARFPMPIRLYDLAQVEENFLTFLEAKPDLHVRYAIKCCPNARVMQRIAMLGGGFEFVSPVELDLALGTGVSGEKCIYSSTVKRAADIRYAYGKGVRDFLADEEYEVRKIAANAPGARLYVRLLVNSKYAVHPLGEKFGTTPEKARRLLRLGKELGLVPYGTHFHVGSQCAYPEAWVEPTRQAAGIFRDLQKEGIDLTLFDIGGGYPSPYENFPSLPSVKTILDGVQRVLDEELPGRPVQLVAEPGRGLVATAGAVSSRVMLRASRPDGVWLHLEAGIFQGLFDALDQYVFQIAVPGREAAKTPYTLCGPTADSQDTISKGQMLPGDITEDDLLVFQNAAAYSEAFDTHFNGIAPPANRYLDEVLPMG